MSLSYEYQNPQRVNSDAAIQPDGQTTAAKAPDSPVTPPATAALRESGAAIAAGSGKPVHGSATTDNIAHGQSSTAAAAGPILSPPTMEWNNLSRVIQRRVDPKRYYAEKDARTAASVKAYKASQAAEKAYASSPNPEAAKPSEPAAAAPKKLEKPTQQASEQLKKQQKQDQALVTLRKTGNYNSTLAEANATIATLKKGDLPAAKLGFWANRRTSPDDKNEIIKKDLISTFSALVASEYDPDQKPLENSRARDFLNALPKLTNSDFATSLMEDKAFMLWGALVRPAPSSDSESQVKQSAASEAKPAKPSASAAAPAQSAQTPASFATSTQSSAAKPPLPPKPPIPPKPTMASASAAAPAQSAQTQASSAVAATLPDLNPQQEAMIRNVNKQYEAYLPAGLKKEIDVKTPAQAFKQTIEWFRANPNSEEAQRLSKDVNRATSQVLILNDVARELANFKNSRASEFSATRDGAGNELMSKLKEMTRPSKGDRQLDPATYRYILIQKAKAGEFDQNSLEAIRADFDSDLIDDFNAAANAENIELQASLQAEATEHGLGNLQELRDAEAKMSMADLSRHLMLRTSKAVKDRHLDLTQAKKLESPPPEIIAFLVANGNRNTRELLESGGRYNQRDFNGKNYFAAAENHVRLMASITDIGLTEGDFKFMFPKGK